MKCMMAAMTSKNVQILQSIPTSRDIQSLLNFSQLRHNPVEIFLRGTILNMMGFFMNTEELASVVRDLDEDRQI